LDLNEINKLIKPKLNSGMFKFKGCRNLLNKLKNIFNNCKIRKNN